MDTVLPDNAPALQHKPLPSILLHLAPGVFILAGIFLFSQPVFCEILGIDPRLNAFLGFILAVLLVLIPVETAIMLFAGKKRAGRWTLRGVIRYTEKSPLWQYFVFVPLFIVFGIFIFGIVSPPINEFLVKNVFPWYPQQYNFQSMMQNPASTINLRGALALFCLYVFAGCLAGPLVEEYYFRGFLLPGMEGYAKSWAWALNAVLFSLYHFFSPWENPARIIGLLPLIFWVWRTRNIRFGILTHILLNTGGAVMMVISILSARAS